MPTKTGDKVRIIVLGTGPDAETARLIAESDADVALAAKFTKTVTHLVIDDTVKTTEARVTKAEEAGVPVISVDEFKALLVAGAEDEVDEVVEAELEESPAETVTATAVLEEAEAEVAAEVSEVETAEVEKTEVEKAQVETAKVEEPEPIADPEPAAEAEPVTVAEAEEPKAEAAPAEPVAEAIDEPEATAADPEKAVPSQAEAPSIENDDKSDKTKPGLIAKIKSIFGMTGARK